jgi:hypothetical protein
MDLNSFKAQEKHRVKNTNSLVSNVVSYDMSVMDLLQIGYEDSFIEIFIDPRNKVKTMMELGGVI